VSCVSVYIGSLDGCWFGLRLKSSTPTCVGVCCGWGWQLIKS
jgi:hypothetical protein